MLGTGDGDFVQVVRALQNRGCRVEIVAFDNVSGNLRREADYFLSGYLIPGLVTSLGKPWGQPGSRVRGVCYYYPSNGKEVGFFRFLERTDGNLWLRDERDDNSPYGAALIRGESYARWAGCGEDPGPPQCSSCPSWFTLPDTCTPP